MDRITKKGGPVLSKLTGAHHETAIHFFKYVVVGSINFVYTTMLLWFLTELYGVHHQIALVLCWTSGTILTYIINFLWVFKPAEKLDFKHRFLKYLFVYLATYGMNAIILEILVQSFPVRPFYLQLTLIPLIIVMNFCGIKYWVMRKE